MSRSNFTRKAVIGSLCSVRNSIHRTRIPRSSGCGSVRRGHSTPSTSLWATSRRPMSNSTLTVRRYTRSAAPRRQETRFKRRLGNLDETFFEMIPKSLAFKPMENVKKFITQFILPERKIEVDVLRENIRSLRDMQKLMEELRQCIGQLEKILQKNDELTEYKRDILIIDTIYENCQAARISRQIQREIEADRNIAAMSSNQSSLKIDS